MAQGTTAGDKVVERIKSKAKMMGCHTEHLLNRYVLERALYRLSEAFGPKMMLKGSMVAVIEDPENARPAPDADVHLKEMADDLAIIVPDLLTRTYYDSNSPTGLVEDHVTFTRFKAVPLEHSEGHGIKIKIEAFVGRARIHTHIDFGFGHGNPSALEVRKFPAMFKGLPEVLLQCQPREDAIADKISAMFDFGMDNTRVKDLYDIAAAIRSGKWNNAGIAKALVRTFEKKGIALDTTVDCLSDEYAAAHEANWQSWLTKAKITDDRTLADVVFEIRQPVQKALRQAVLRQAHEQEARPVLRLVSSR